MGNKSEGLLQIGQALDKLSSSFQKMQTQQQTRQLSKAIGKSVGVPDFETDDPALATLMVSYGTMLKSGKEKQVDPYERIKDILSIVTQGGASESEVAGIKDISEEQFKAEQRAKNPNISEQELGTLAKTQYPDTDFKITQKIQKLLGREVEPTAEEASAARVVARQQAVPTKRQIAEKTLQSLFPGTPGQPTPGGIGGGSQRIRVRLADGSIGTIDASEFDASTMTKLP